MQETQQQLRDYMARSYKTILTPDVRSDGTRCFVARHPGLPGCMSDGDTPAEAIKNLRDARELYIQSLLEDGLEVPLPQTVVVLPATTTTGRGTPVNVSGLWEVQWVDARHTRPSLVGGEDLEDVTVDGLERPGAETATGLAQVG